MSSAMWVIVTVMVATLLAVGGYALMQKRRSGPEYERALNKSTDRRVATSP